MRLFSLVAGISMLLVACAPSVQVERFGHYQIQTSDDGQGLWDSLKGEWVVPLNTKQYIYHIRANKYFAVHNREDSLTYGLYLMNDSSFFTREESSCLLSETYDDGVFVELSYPQDEENLSLQYAYNDLLVHSGGLGTARMSGNAIVEEEIVGGLYNAGEILIKFNNELSSRVVNDDFGLFRGQFEVFRSKDGQELLRRDTSSFLVRGDTLLVWRNSIDTSLDWGSEDYLGIEYSVQEKFLVRDGNLERIEVSDVDHEGVQRTLGAGFYGGNHIFEGEDISSFDDPDFQFQEDSLAIMVKDGDVRLRTSKGNVKRFPDRELYSDDNGTYRIQRMGQFIGVNYLQWKEFDKAEVMLDGEPFMIEIESGDHNRSGVIDIANSRWLIQPEYFRVFIVDSLILAYKSSHIPVNVDEIDIEMDEYGFLDLGIYGKEPVISLDIFDLKGTKLREGITEDIFVTIGEVFNVDSLSNGVSDAQMKVMHKAGYSSYWTTVTRRANVWAPQLAWDDKVIAGSLSSCSRTYFRKNGDAVMLGYFNSSDQWYNVVYHPSDEGVVLNYYSDPERTVYKRTEDPFYGSGLKCIPNASELLLTNSMVSEIRRELMPYQVFDEFGPYDSLDANGHVVYPVELKEGFHFSGLYDTKQSEWLIPPIYFNGIARSDGGYTFMKVHEVFNSDTTSLTTWKEYFIYDENKKLAEVKADSLLTLKERLRYVYDIPIDAVVKQYGTVKDTSFERSWLLRKGGKLMTVHNNYDDHYEIKAPWSDWVYNDKLVLEGDSVYLWDTLAVSSENVTIKISEGAWDIVQEDTTLYYFGELSYITQREESFFDEQNGYVFRFSQDTISVQSPNSIVSKFVSFDAYGDRYFIEYHVCSSDDEIWVRRDGSWQLDFSSGHIEELDFGYFIIEPYCLEVETREWGGEMEAVPEVGGSLVNSSMEPIDQCDGWLIYRHQRKGNHYVMDVEIDGEKKRALISRTGKVYSTEYDVYSIEDDPNTFKCYNIDPEWGDIMVDANGNPIIETIVIDE